MLDVFLLCHFICTHKLSSNMIMIHQQSKFSAYYRQTHSASNTNSARFTSIINWATVQAEIERTGECDYCQPKLDDVTGTNVRTLRGYGNRFQPLEDSAYPSARHFAGFIKVLSSLGDCQFTNHNSPALTMAGILAFKLLNNDK